MFDSNGRKRSDKPELSDEDFLKKNGFPRREPGFRNAEMLQYISSFLPRKILKYFAGLSNSVVTRVKMSDPHTRAIAVSVVDAISDVFLALLTYEETKGDDVDAYLYWFCCTNFVLAVLSGGIVRFCFAFLTIGNDPNPHGQTQEKLLQTFLLYRFHKAGGPQVVLNTIKSLTVSLGTIDKEKVSDHERLVAIIANLKKLFLLVRLFINENHISEVPQTAALANRDRYRGQDHYFNLSEYLTDTRATCVPVFCELMGHLEVYDKGTAQPFLSIMSELIAGGHEEVHSDGMKYDEPDEGAIARIAAHGFDRPLIHATLLSHGYVESSALQHLISRRGAVPPSEAAPEPPPESTSAPPQESTSAAPQESTSAQQDSTTAAPIPPLNFDDLSDDPHLLDLVYEAQNRMDIDEPEIGLAAPDRTAASDKGKDKAEDTTKKPLIETRAETLARLRAEFSRNLENYVTDVLIYHPDLPFELAHMIKSVGKWESNEWIQDRMLELAARLASMEDDKGSKAREITACAHVLGLLLSDKRYYEAAESSIIAFLDGFVEFLNVGVNGETPWIASVSLIIEIVIRELEWRQTKKRLDPAFADVDVPEFDADFFTRLMEKLVDIIKSDVAEETVVVCALRLLVRLTRESQYATIFREQNGLQSLLQLNHRLAGKSAVKISEPSVIIIRNLVEDEKIIVATMRTAIRSVLDTAAQRGRGHIELSELLRSKNSDVLRNPELFGEAVESIAKLHNFSSTNNSRKLVKKVEETVSEQESKPEGGQDKPPAAPETPKKPTWELSHSSGVVQVLLTELLSHQSDVVSLPKKDPTKEAVSDPTKETVSDPLETPPNDDAAPATKSKMSPEEVNEFTYTLFLLQVLAELVGSYNNCKLEFVNYSRRGQSREPMTPSKPRSMMLNYLLNDLLPTGHAQYNGLATQDMAHEKRRGVSLLVITVISSLCKKTPENYENDDRPDLLINVRKFVLEGIAKSLKETLGSSGPVQQRYSRYTALAEVCRRLLQSQSPLVHPNIAFDVAGSSAMAKLMYEKGFVGLLASVVADIELDFPDVKAVINDILATLKDLTTCLNRLVQNGSLDTGSVSGDVEEISTASSASEDEEEEAMQDRDDTPDVFRHSALGIMQGVVEDAPHRDRHHLHDFDEYDEEMDYDEDEDDGEEDQSGSEDDDMDDDEGDDDMDVYLPRNLPNFRFELQ